MLELKVDLAAAALEEFLAEQRGKDDTKEQHDKRLFDATIKSDLDAMLHELEFGGATPDAHTDPRHGLTTGPALHAAAKLGLEEPAKLLLAWGANVSGKDHQGLSPLHVACYNGRVNLALLLVENGADVDKLDVIGLDNPWEEFETEGRSYWCHLETDESTWEPPPKPKGRKGLSPVICACLTEKMPILEFLADQGANIAAVDNCGRTGLHIAAMKGNLDMLSFFLHPPIKGIDALDIMKKDHSGLTPLHAAARFGQTKMVDALVHAIAIRMNKKYTKPSDHVYAKILHAIKATTKDEATPLDLANSHRKIGTVEQLRAFQDSYQHLDLINSKVNL
jgi:ankyrin repeat protein